MPAAAEINNRRKMTEEQKQSILAASANWSREFLLAKLREIFSPTPIEELLKIRISSSLLNDIDEVSAVLKKDISLHGELDSNEKIAYARNLIKENRVTLMSHSETLYSEVIAEINEIKEDNKWRKTQEGKLIIAIEKWIASAYRSMSDDMKGNILIGRNILDDDPCNIIIGGYSEKMTQSQIECFFMALKPPVRPFFIIKHQ